MFLLPLSPFPSSFFPFLPQVSHRALEERVLKLTVLDVDRHKRHQVIGHALYPLREHDCENNVRLVIWRDLEREVSEVGHLGATREEGESWRCPKYLFTFCN